MEGKEKDICEERDRKLALALEQRIARRKKARELIIITNEDMLRVALDKYNQLIRKHPPSDKIDDAAYRAAGIYEYFKDYTIAIL